VGVGVGLGVGVGTGAGAALSLPPPPPPPQAVKVAKIVVISKACGRFFFTAISKRSLRQFSVGRAAFNLRIILTAANDTVF
jgi:hypothetical protein